MPNRPSGLMARLLPRLPYEVTRDDYPGGRPGPVIRLRLEDLPPDEQARYTRDRPGRQDILDALRAGEGAEDVAERCGVTVKQVQSVAVHMFGFYLPTREEAARMPEPVWWPPDDILREMYADNARDSWIAELLLTTPYKVARRRVEIGIATAPIGPGEPGERKAWFEKWRQRLKELQEAEPEGKANPGSDAGTAPQEQESAGPDAGAPLQPPEPVRATPATRQQTMSAPARATPAPTVAGATTAAGLRETTAASPPSTPAPRRRYTVTGAMSLRQLLTELSHLASVIGDGTVVEVDLAILQGSNPS